jgi:hypothetical protein
MARERAGFRSRARVRLPQGANSVSRRRLPLAPWLDSPFRPLLSRKPLKTRELETRKNQRFARRQFACQQASLRRRHGIGDRPARSVARRFLILPLGHGFDATDPQSRRHLDWMSQTSVHCMNKVARRKIGAGSPRESPAPISVSPSPKMPDIGRGRHFFNKLWLTVGSVLRPKKLFLWMPRNEAKLFGQSCRRDNYQK